MALYPDELRFPPRPVIALMGMEHVHSAILSSLNAGDPRCSFHVRTMSMDTKFPAKKDKHDYDVYVPTGIVKDNWMKKHQLMLPSVVLLLHTATPEPDVVLKDAVAECMEHVRHNFNGHHFKTIVCLVLTQGAVDPAMVDKQAENVRRGLNSDSKNLLVLNMNSLSSSIQKLEKLALDLAHVFYKDEGRRIKKIKSASPQMHVRHHFKIAYYAEFRRDPNNALKYYHSAYGALGDVIRSTSIDVFEVKTVADYINFRICVLYVQTNRHADAVDHFLNHMNTYRTKVGRPMLTFMHHKWMQRQYDMMGQLLENTRAFAMQDPSGRHGNKVMDSAYYWTAGAHHARLYRQELQKTQEEMVGEGPPAIPPQSLVFVGQLPTAPDRSIAHHFASKLNAADEDGVMRLLTKAYNHAKQNQETNGTCQREVMNLASQIADEHVYQRHFNSALRLLHSVAGYFRSEGWASLLASRLCQARLCARNLHEVELFVQFSFELCSPELGLGLWRRKEVFDQVVCLLSNLASGRPASECFDGMLGADVDAMASAEGDSQERVGREMVTAVTPVGRSVLANAHVTTELAKDHPFIKCRLRFDAEAKPIKTTFRLFVHLTSLAPRAITFSSLRLTFSLKQFNITVAHSQDASPQESTWAVKGEEGGEGNEFQGWLLFEPEQEHVLVFEFCVSDPIRLECHELLACYNPVNSQDGKDALVLMWKAGDRSRSRSWVSPNLDEEDAGAQWQATSPDRKESNSIEVVIPTPNISTQLLHTPPALLGEWFEVTVCVDSNTDTMTHACLFVEVPSFGEDLSYCKLIGADGAQPLPSAGLALPSPFAPHTKFHATVCVHVEKLHGFDLVVKIRYESHAGTPQSIESNFPIPVVQPLHFTPTFVSAFPNADLLMDKSTAMPLPLRTPRGSRASAESGLRGDAAYLQVDELATVLADLTGTAPHRINIVSCSFLPSMHNDQPLAELLCDPELPQQHDPALVSTSLAQSDSHTLAFPLVPRAVAACVVLGSVAVRWQRMPSAAVMRATPQGEVVEATGVAPGMPEHIEAVFALPGVLVYRPAIGCVLSVPPSTSVGEVLPVTAKLTNHTTQLHTVEVSVEDSAVFLLSGVKHCLLQVLPKCTLRVPFLFVPVAAGTHVLPQIRVKAKSLNKDLLDPMLPRSVLVMPPAQTSPLVA